MQIQLRWQGHRHGADGQADPWHHVGLYDVPETYFCSKCDTIISYHKHSWALASTETKFDVFFCFFGYFIIKLEGVGGGGGAGLIGLSNAGDIVGGLEGRNTPGLGISSSVSQSLPKGLRLTEVGVVPENWIEVFVFVELRTVRIMTQGDSNLRPLWRSNPKVLSYTRCLKVWP